jgi:hypothetical protein
MITLNRGPAAGQGSSELAAIQVDPKPDHDRVTRNDPGKPRIPVGAHQTCATSRETTGRCEPFPFRRAIAEAWNRFWCRGKSKEDHGMRSLKMTTSLAVLAVGAALSAVPALAQDFPPTHQEGVPPQASTGRPLNDGGFGTQNNGNARNTNSPWVNDGFNEQRPIYNSSSDWGPDWYSGPSNGMRDQGVAASCQARFRSFDPATGTYLGFDGRRHPCG